MIFWLIFDVNPVSSMTDLPESTGHRKTLERVPSNPMSRESWPCLSNCQVDPDVPRQTSTESHVITCPYRYSGSSTRKDSKPPPVTSQDSNRLPAVLNDGFSMNSAVGKDRPLSVLETLENLGSISQGRPQDAEPLSGTSPINCPSSNQQAWDSSLKHQRPVRQFVRKASPFPDAYHATRTG